jgi:hypothetical protein
MQRDTVAIPRDVAREAAPADSRQAADAMAEKALGEVSCRQAFKLGRAARMRAGDRGENVSPKQVEVSFAVAAAVSHGARSLGACTGTIARTQGLSRSTWASSTATMRAGWRAPSDASSELVLLICTRALTKSLASMFRLFARRPRSGGYVVSHPGARSDRESWRVELEL